MNSVKEDKYSRKEKIMQAALALFADRGYSDTSTKEIAAQAGVSEALIFKHFGNKDALLNHLIKAGYRRVLMHHKGMLTYKNAKDFLKNMISLPHKLVKEDPLFWKMQRRLSYMPFSRSQHELFIKPVQPIILKAFTDLGYDQPDIETEFLLLVIDILWKKGATNELVHPKELVLLLENKYNLI